MTGLLLESLILTPVASWSFINVRDISLQKKFRRKKSFIIYEDFFFNV